MIPWSTTFQVSSESHSLRRRRKPSIEAILELCDAFPSVVADDAPRGPIARNAVPVRRRYIDIMRVLLEHAFR